MKKVLAVFSILVVVTASVQAADFSGTWKLNKEKSKLHEQFSMAPREMILLQAENNFDVEKHSAFRDQEFTINKIRQFYQNWVCQVFCVKDKFRAETFLQIQWQIGSVRPSSHGLALSIS